MFVLDDLESSPERVILYSGVSQAILASVPLGEYKMQDDALANTNSILDWCYGPCEYLPLLRYRQANAWLVANGSVVLCNTESSWDWMNSLTEPLISFKRTNNWPGRASFWTRAKVSLKANASSCTWVHRRGSSICRWFNRPHESSVFPLRWCIWWWRLRRLLQAVMAAATSSKKYRLTPDILPRY